MSPNELAARAVLRTVLVVLGVVGALALIWLLRRPLGWLVLALFLAVAMSGPVNALGRRVNRNLAIAIAYLGLFFAPIGLIGVITPSVVNGIDDLVQELPGYAQDVRTRIEDDTRLRRLDRQYGITDRLVHEAGRLPNRLGGAAGRLKDVGVGVVNSIFAGVTILILSIFIVAGGRGWIDAALRSQPHARAVRIRRALDRSGNAVGNYVRGVLLQATIAGLSTWVVLLILGVPFAAPLAVLVAVLDAIPLIGATIGAVLVLLVTLFVDFPTATIIWAVWAIVYQQVENTVIQPRIQSKAVNVHPFVVIVSVLFGSTLFGVVGALLAVPAAASVQILAREALEYRRERLVAAPGPVA